LGKSDFAATTVTSCASPTASTLCRPYDVVSDPSRKRVIVSDQKESDNAGRVWPK
jgi:hypothetical protein